MTGPVYGYLHRGVAVAYDADADGWTVRVAALAPGRTMGPFPTMAAGVAAGERVILASVGTSRDDLVILGRVPTGFPDIGDIPGLTAALAGKADDSEITALDGRLDVVEPIVSGHTTTLSGHTTTLAGHTTSIANLVTEDTALDGRLDVLENYLDTQGPERDLFSDLLSTTPRNGVSSGLALTNGTIYLMRLITRRALSVTQIRMATSVVASGPGAGVAGVYGGAALTAMTLLGSASISLTTLGRTTALPSTATIPAGHNVLIAILPTAWTVGPQMAARPAVVHTSLLNPNAGLATAMTKAGQTSLPSTINTTDGTWVITGTSTIWAALGGALI